MSPTCRGPGLAAYRSVDIDSLQRGQIISFLHTEGWAVKRVIGLPGDRVTISLGNVFVQRPKDPLPWRLIEPYLAPSQRTDRCQSAPGATSLYHVPPEHVFVLADNRLTGSDSRSFQQDHRLPSPYVPVAAIKGQLILYAGRSGTRAFWHPPDYPKQYVPVGLIPDCPRAYPCRPTTNQAPQALLGCPGTYIDLLHAERFDQRFATPHWWSGGNTGDY